MVVIQKRGCSAGSGMRPASLRERGDSADVHEISYVHDIVNGPISVNDKRRTGIALERALASKLQELLQGISWLGHWCVERVRTADNGCDLGVNLPLANGGVVLSVVCKSELRPIATSVA